MKTAIKVVSGLCWLLFVFGCTQEASELFTLREDVETSTLNAIKVGYTYYFSGITAWDRETNSYPEGTAGQTKAIMDKYATALNELGMDWDNVVKANVYITDIQEKPLMNEVYYGYFEGFKRPCRVCVEAGLEGDAVVEIAMIAVKTGQ